MATGAFDVVVVGGGPAGLSAALVLGRCRRSVLVLDDGEPRNAVAPALHGFLTRDGTPPLELLRAGREELERYGVAVRQERAMGARCVDDCAPLEPMFEVTLANGGKVTARRLLLATGVRDRLPEVEGARRYYGRGVYHCPYCDAWEHSDQPLAVLGADADAVAAALGLLTWSTDVTLLLDGGELPAAAAERLSRNGVSTASAPVVEILGDGERAHGVALEGGEELRVGAVFFHTQRHQASDLPDMLGCILDENEDVKVRGPQKTGVPGLFMAGDADGDVQFVIVAAAEGARAAVAINHDLQKEERA
ncbi:MAG: NAD(P)/FAD-dependent oxidoreductase [Gemmatimonadetes bacterium]|nr:NAD(P)/FAD-dependent oxidoreductase [Gemmatimonadota bacterium]